jgi:dihydrofolate reductase
VTAIRVSIIAAVADNGVIGRDNALPWRLPSDMKRFRAITMGKPVVMGRKTLQSIGRPLPGRTNIVVSRGVEPPAPGVVMAANLADALAEARLRAAGDGVDEVFVIGGAALYREALPLADRLYITEVKAAPAGDATFPPIDRRRWKERAREAPGRAAGDSEDSAFVVYDRTTGR